MCESAISQRHVSRHAVEIPCEVITSHRDRPVLSWAIDMSGGGAWLETDELLDPGEHLVICFAPGVFWRAREIQVFAEVVRISYGLRLGDRGAGMAIRFLDLTPAERWALRCWLRPRPMPMPRRRGPTGRVVAFAAPSAASPFAARLG
jgi:hypothetical protein